MKGKKPITYGKGPTNVGGKPASGSITNKSPAKKFMSGSKPMKPSKG